MFETKDKIVKLKFNKNNDLRILIVEGEKTRNTYFFRYKYDDTYVARKVGKKYILEKDHIKFIMENFPSDNSTSYFARKKKVKEFVEWLTEA